MNDANGNILQIGSRVHAKPEDGPMITGVVRAVDERHLVVIHDGSFARWDNRYLLPLDEGGIFAPDGVFWYYPEHLVIVGSVDDSELTEWVEDQNDWVREWDMNNDLSNFGC